ncbi:hypothetical protein FRC17_007860, partial [Serendipita sp. 399]
MSEPRTTDKDGGGHSNRGKRPPRGAGGGSNSQGGGRGNGTKRTGNNGNRDSDSQASDVSTKRRSNSGRGRGGGPGGRRPSRPGSATQPSPKVVNHPPMPSDGESSALSNLQKVITDLKSMPAPNQGQSQPQTQNQAQQAANQAPSVAQATPAVPTYAQTTQSNLTPTAPPFQPSFAPGEVPPRHRKAQSMGPTPSGPGAPPGYGMGGYAPYLDSMSEDVEPQGPETPITTTMNQYSNRPPMGSFQAPRFANMSQQASEADSVGPSGRPQLAPSFSFGGGTKRRTNSMSVGPGPAIGEEDAGFQFPQQNQQPRQQNQQDSYDANQSVGGSHRRT